MVAFRGAHLVGGLVAAVATITPVRSALATSECWAELVLLQPVAPEPSSRPLDELVTAPVDVIPAARVLCPENASPSPPVIRASLTRADGTEVAVAVRDAAFWAGRELAVEMVPAEPLVVGETYTSAFWIDADEPSVQSVTFQTVEASPPPATPAIELRGAQLYGDHLEAEVEATWPSGDLLRMTRIETLPSGAAEVRVHDDLDVTGSVLPGDDDDRYCVTALVRDAAGHVAESEPACDELPSGCSVGTGPDEGLAAVVPIALALAASRRRALRRDRRAAVAP